MVPLFHDRADAGQQLATRLKNYAGRPDVLVLALPRGGVPVAFEVARALGAPLDVFLVRKLGVPGQEELAMGAIASGGTYVLNDEVVDGLQIPPRVIRAVADTERRELERRERHYRGDHSPPDVCDRIVILVDDGLATGSTMRAAAAALRRNEAGLARRRCSGRRRRDLRSAPARGRCGHLRGHPRAVLCRRHVVSRLLADDRRGGPCPDDEINGVVAQLLPGLKTS